MKHLAILSAVAAFGVLGFVGSASATGALPLADNQTIHLIVECEPGWAPGKIHMHVDAFRRGGGPKFPIPQVDFIFYEVFYHSPGEGDPDTDTLGTLMSGDDDGTNDQPLPDTPTVQATCANVPGDANTIGVEGHMHIKANTSSGFVGLEIPFRCFIPNNCP